MSWLHGFIMLFGPKKFSVSELVQVERDEEHLIRGYIDPICTLTNFFGSIGSVFGGKFFGAVTDRHFASLGGVITRLSLATSLHGQIWPFPPSQLSPLLFGSRRSYWLLRKTGSVTHSIRSMRCA